MWKHLVKPRWIVLLSLMAVGVGVSLALSGPKVSSPLIANHQAAASESGEPQAAEPATTFRVETTTPKPGGVQRVSIQPGSVIGFESAQLFAKVSGYLKFQPVDIGSLVKRGQVLAEIDAPELFRDADQAKAAVDQAKAAVAQAEARVLTAQADKEAAQATVKQNEAEVDRTIATRSFREKQYQRIKDLFEARSIDGRLVDEKFEEMESALAAQHAAEAAVATAKAQVSAAGAKVEQAKSDLANAKAQVEVAEATRARANVFVDYTRIISPYDGVVTKRSYFLGDFIRAADQGGLVPLLAVNRTDVMRVVVQIPDRDVPYTNVGDPADVEIDALPGKSFSAKVSRIADAEDPETRTMRIEVDLPNKDNLLRQGMYGRVTVHLERSGQLLSVFTSSVVNGSDLTKPSVFVVKDGVAKLTPVVLGVDNGLRVEVLQGLQPGDAVVQRPPAGLSDGARVEVISRQAAE